jgi:hypothetical protein
MKRILPLLSMLGCLSAFAATAPDSIAGKVYHETSILIHSRSSSEKTIVFGADGRFTYLTIGGGSALNANAAYKIFLGSPPLDGTYTYQRIDDSNATIALRYDDGSSETMNLTFTSATGGSDSTFPSYTFFLSDPATTLNAPAINVSMRGHVDGSHPLIVGFVVPGGPPPPVPYGFTPPPGFQQREVLIRAVGPSLTQFGVTGVWADPDFQLFQGNAPASVNEVHYGDWTVSPYFGNVATSATTEAAFRKIFSYVGAFSLQSGSKDAAQVVRLNPSAYTVVCTAAPGDAGGEVLVEVYFLP